MSDRVKPLSKDEIQDPEMQQLVEGAEQMLGDSRFARLMVRQPGIMKRFFDLYGYMYENASVEGRVQLVERVVSEEECGCPITDLKTGGQGLRIYRDGRAIGFWEDECQTLQPGDVVVEIVPTAETETG